MPPKRNHDEAQTASLKEKLQHIQGTNPRGRRNGGTTNGSNLKEVDNASTNSGQTSNDLNSSNVSYAPAPLQVPHRRPTTATYGRDS